MIHFLLGVYEAVAHHPPCNILLVGRDGVGKTTLFEQLRHMFGKGHAPQSPNEAAVANKTIRPTVGLNVASLLVAHQEVKLMDLGGQSSLRAMWSSYFSASCGVIFVTDETSSSDQLAEDHCLLRVLFNCKALTGAPIAILANKCDLGSFSSAQGVGAGKTSKPLSSVQDGLGLLDLVLGTRLTSSIDAADRGLSSSSGAGGKLFKLFEVSARRGDGVEAALQWIVEQSLASPRWGSIENDT